jgi:excisionase family DNA binding protein
VADSASKPRTETKVVFLDNVPSWMEPAAAAAYLGISVRKLRDLLRRGEGPAHTRLGRLIRIHRDAADQWMKERSA